MTPAPAAVAFALLVVLGVLFMGLAGAASIQLTDFATSKVAVTAITRSCVVAFVLRRWTGSDTVFALAAQAPMWYALPAVVTGIPALHTLVQSSFPMMFDDPLHADVPDVNITLDADFLAAHRSGALPFAAWTHAAHCRLTFSVFVAGGRDAALTAETVKADIQRFNARHVEKLSVGFHATMTHFWVFATTAVFGHVAPTCVVFSDCWPTVSLLLGNSRLWQLFYSRDLMFSSAAKAVVHAPDLRPLSALSDFMAAVVHPATARTQVAEVDGYSD